MPTAAVPGAARSLIAKLAAPMITEAAATGLEIGRAGLIATRSVQPRSPVLNEALGDRAIGSAQAGRRPRSNSATCGRPRAAAGRWPCARAMRATGPA